MKRRSFVKNLAAGIGIPLIFQGTPLQAFPFAPFGNTDEQSADRILILIHLNGGNDGLNTLIPLDQYDKLSNVRSNLVIPEQKIIKINDTVGMHPSMGSLQPMISEGKMAFVNSVGYPNQNRSHFRSIDIWNSGSPFNEYWHTGWMGRHLDDSYNGYPERYPNEQNPDPFAMALGNITSPACTSAFCNFSVAVDNPNNLSLIIEEEDTEIPNTPYGYELGHIRSLIGQTNSYGTKIKSVYQLGKNTVDYPSNNVLANQLSKVARFISGGLKTQIYICTLNGFDTHANQANAADVTQGEHANLLRTLADAITAFQNDIDQLGFGTNVIGMTYSEFGRRIMSNNSYGTDHGSAAPVILFGNCVEPGFIGDNPEIPDDVTINDGVAMQFDFRDLYASVLEDWFNVSPEKINTIFNRRYNKIKAISPCNLLKDKEEFDPFEVNEGRATFNNYPNPFIHKTAFSFSSRAEHVHLSIFDGLGREIKTLVNKTLPAGQHEVNWYPNGIAPGNYYGRLVLESGFVKTKLIVKTQ